MSPISTMPSVTLISNEETPTVIFVARVTGTSISILEKLFTNLTPTTTISEETARTSPGITPEEILLTPVTTRQPAIKTETITSSQLMITITNLEKTNPPVVTKAQPVTKSNSKSLFKTPTKSVSANAIKTGKVTTPLNEQKITASVTTSTETAIPTLLITVSTSRTSKVRINFASKTLTSNKAATTASLTSIIA